MLYCESKDDACEDGLTDKNYYRRAFAVAAEYCAELCKKYNISTSNIVGHCEAYKQGYGSNHADPEHWMKKHGETMDDFRKSVSAILKTSDVKTENKSETAKRYPYLVKVTANALNIRKGAGTNTGKVGVITDKGVYTIVEERKGSGASMWGKLKSGVGWISLDFVKRL